METKSNYKEILYGLVKTWILCYGALTLQVVAGYWTSHLYLPYVGFLLIAAIIYYGNHSLRRTSMHCSMMTHYTAYTLLASGAIMLVANLFNTNFITNQFSEFSHKDYPFHASFIVYPLATFFYGFALLRRGIPEYCQACREMASYSVKESMRRNVLHHESIYQLKFAFAISLFQSVITYLYYFMYYSESTYGRRHSPDIFFMYVFPAAIFAVAVIYMLLRYSTVEFEISLHLSEDNPDERATTLRYMVVWKDRVLLRDTQMDGVALGYWDTPANVKIMYQESVSDGQAQKEFGRIYGNTDFNVRRLFATNYKNQNVFHFAAFIGDDSEDPMGKFDGKWMDLREMDELLKSRQISRPFAMELHRVFTITMAWKTYDRNGKRLYPIKNYRPTFRLSDFKKWDVDYEDLHWLSISENNQDKPFYYWRKFWRKYINGLDNRWNQTRS